MPNAAHAFIRHCIQKVATGPEYSKDLTEQEAHDALAIILAGEADPVQAGILLIALRMKRESMDEYKGMLSAMQANHLVTASVDDLVMITDPYDGFSRTLPVSPFLPALLAAAGVPAYSHGLATVGPKYGITHHTILKAAGIDVSATPQQAAQQLSDKSIGWSYLDQAQFNSALHSLIPLRELMVKRPSLTTLETLLKPISAAGKTHFVTGFVHKAYPPVYAALAQFNGFDTGLIIRGVEGGVMPSLQQAAKQFHYDGDNPPTDSVIDPSQLGIERTQRGIAVEKSLYNATEYGDRIDLEAASKAAANVGLDALSGHAGPARDGLIYAGSLIYSHVHKVTIEAAQQQLKRCLDNGKALQHFNALRLID